MTLTSPRARTGLFVAAALVINIVDALAIRAAAGTPRAAWVGAGAVLDLVGVVTLLYWGLLVRPGLRGRASMAVVAAVSAARAALLLPTPPPLRLAIVGLLEAGLVGALAWVAWSAGRRGPAVVHASDDLVETLRATAARLVPVPAVADAIAAELAVLAYACGLPRPGTAPEAQRFSLVRRSGFDGLVGVLMFAGLAEITVMHVVVAHWHPAAAWAVTAAGVYGLVYLRGLTRAIAERPVLVRAESVVVRYGLTFHLEVPAAAIAALASATRATRADATVPRRRTPAWVLTLEAPCEARGLFGRRQLVRTVAITVDDDAAFGHAVGALIARRTGRTSS